MAKPKEKKEQELVKVRIPLDPLNPSVKTITPIINGKSLQIELGKTVEIPANYYNLLVEAGRI